MNSPHKVPTERLLFFSTSDQKPIRPKNIFSIASSVHSRKPQIYDILETELQNEKPSNENLKQKKKRNQQTYHQKLAKGCYGLFKRKNISIGLL